MESTCARPAPIDLKVERFVRFEGSLVMHEWSAP